MARIWTVPYNVDAHNALMYRLVSDADRSLALQGLSLGLNGGECPAGVPDAFRWGWELGIPGRRKAEELQAKQQEGGKASAALRVVKFGTAQPPRSGLRSDLEDTPEVPSNLTNNPLILSNDETKKPETDIFAALMSSWNETLGHLDCFSKCGVMGTERKKMAKARLKEDPNFLQTFQKALSYMAVDSWFKDKSFAIDYLLRAGRAQELSEKKPTEKAATGNGHARRTHEVDEIFLEQLKTAGGDW